MKSSSSKAPPEDYAKVNRATYDALVAQYEARMSDDTPGDLMLMAPFFYFLELSFGSSASLNLLDIGCGNGLNLKMMTDRGHSATGIDVSPGMAKLARTTAPRATVTVDDFLTTNLLQQSFHGIFAKAIIHLFPKVDVRRFLNIVRSALHPDGVFYVTTTIEAFSDEGFCEKQDYIGKPIRYRARWTENELVREIIQAGFQIRWHSIDREHDRKKSWINLWAVKSHD